MIIITLVAVNCLLETSHQPKMTMAKGSKPGKIPSRTVCKGCNLPPRGILATVFKTIVLAASAPTTITPKILNASVILFEFSPTIVSIALNAKAAQWQQGNKRCQSVKLKRFALLSSIFCHHINFKANTLGNHFPQANGFISICLVFDNVFNNSYN